MAVSEPPVTSIPDVPEPRQQGAGALQSCWLLRAPREDTVTGTALPVPPALLVPACSTSWCCQSGDAVAAFWLA